MCNCDVSDNSIVSNVSVVGNVSIVRSVSSASDVSRKKTKQKKNTSTPVICSPKRHLYPQKVCYANKRRITAFTRRFNINPTAIKREHMEQIPSASACATIARHPQPFFLSVPQGTKGEPPYETFLRISIHYYLLSHTIKPNLAADHQGSK